MFSSTGGVVFHILFTVSLGILSPIKADVELKKENKQKVSLERCDFKLLHEPFPPSKQATERGIMRITVT